VKVSHIFPISRVKPTNGTILRRGISAIRLVSNNILFRYIYVYHHERFDEKAAICIS